MLHRKARLTLSIMPTVIWAGLAGGAAMVGEGIRAYAYPAIAIAMPGRFAIILVLALAIKGAGAAAGSYVPARTPF